MEPEIIYEDDLGSTKKPKYWVWILLIIIAAVLVLKWPSDVAATVNGEKISQSDIDETYEQMPEMYKQSITKEQILNQTINEVLLLQEAEEKGIIISEEEIQERITLIIQQNGMTEEQFEDFLEENDYSIEQIESQVKSNLVIEKLIESSVDLNTTEEEIETFYMNNQNLFTTPKKVNISHILICYKGAAMCDDNRTQEGAEFIVNEFRNSDIEFGTLAEKYSDGPSSVNKGNLGFIDENSNLVPEFKQAALELEEGEVSDVVHTDYGYHLIKAYEVIESSVEDLDDVKERIEQTIVEEKTSYAINTLIKELRKKSEIKYH